jgi:hypothetical protein
MTATGPSLRDRLATEIPAGTELLRNLRYLPAADLADISDDDLEAAARWLRAAAYSAREGARHLERLMHQRQEPST